jgi:aryl-alcohol dehydrogenase-like predicted oxidoreductase
VVSEIAAARDATPSQVALAWLLARRPWIVPIPGTKRSAYVEDNAGAVAVQLEPEDIARLDGLAANAQGDRYGSGGALPNWLSPPLER